MSLASAVSRWDFTGNGSTSVYAYTRKIFANTDLLVTVRNTSDVETTLALTTDYTVSGVGEDAGGSITLVNASQAWLTSGNLTTDYVLTIRRVRPLTQATDIRNQGEFFPETHEDAFDHFVMIDQQQQDELDRSAKLPETLAASGFDPTLPVTLPDNAGAAIIVNSLGTGFTLGVNTAGTDSSRVAKIGDTMTGNLQMNAATGTKYGDSDSSNFITVKAPSSVTADYNVVWPATAPTASRFLKYDGTDFAWAFSNGITSAKSDSYIVTDTDGIETILMTTAASDRTVTLPTAADNTHRKISIKKIDSGAGAVIIDGEGSETIDGAATRRLPSQYDEMVIQCNGTAWFVLSEHYRNIRAAAHKITSSQTITADTETEITFTEEREDSNAAYNTSTSRFTAPVGGLYHFSYSVQAVTGGTPSTAISVWVYKNGAGGKLSRFAFNDVAASKSYPSSGSGYINLDAGDYVSVWCIFETTGGTVAFNNGANEETAFSIYCVNVTG